MAEGFYYPSAAPAPAQPVTGVPGPVLLAVAGPAAQSRATVAVRLILALPHLVVLYFLGLAASVVAVIGWFGALATGQLPAFAAAYLSGYLRWSTRVSAYLLLLTGEYPPFTFDDVAYPVRLGIGSGQLNRLTVLFRLILVIPAALVSYLLTSGFAAIVIFVGWLAALVAGRLPESFHLAYTAVLRYSVRCNGYVYLLTGDYPGQLFGEQPGQPAPGAPAAYPPGQPAGFPGQAGPYPGYGTPGYGTPGYGPAGYGPQGYGTPGYGGQVQGPPGYEPTSYGAPGYQPTQGYPPGPGYPPAGYTAPGGQPPWPSAPAQAAAGPEPGWRLVLSPGARRLMSVLLVLGLLTVAAGGAGIGAAIVAASHRAAKIRQLDADVIRFSGAVGQHDAAVTRARQESQQVSQASDALLSAHDKLVSVLNTQTDAFNGCTTVSCFNTTSVPVVDALATFNRSLLATAMPSGSAADARQLSADTTATQRDWQAAAQDTSFDGLEDDTGAAETDGDKYDKDYATLQASLSQQGQALDGTSSKLNAEAETLNREGAALRGRASALNVIISVPAAEPAT